MTEYSATALQARVTAVITANGSRLITGTVLKTLLTDFIDSLAFPGTIEIADIDGLAAALAAAAQGTTGAIAIGDVTNLQSSLDTLATAISGKASSSHNQAIATITDLQAALDTHTTNINTVAATAAALDTRLDTAELAIDALEAAGGAGSVSELVSGANVRFEATATGAFVYAPTFANNAAALTGGLVAGELYKTSDGSVKIVLAQGGVGGTPPPTNSVLISTWDPVNDDNYYSPEFLAADAGDPKGGPTRITFWYGTPGSEKKWVSDLSFQPWCLTSADDAVIRFEVRAGDLFDVPGFYTDSAGVERNKITEISADWHAPTDDLHFTLDFMVEGPPITSNFFSLLEIHTYGSGVIAQKFELVIANERLKVTANADVVTNGTPAYRTLWTDTQAVVRGKWYTADIFVRSNRSATPAGRVVVDIDGVRKVDFTGRTGYLNETQCAMEFGIYRGTSSPETIAVSYRNLEYEFGAYGTLTIPAAGSSTPPGETFGNDLLGGMTSSNYMAVDATLSNDGSGYLNVTSGTFPTADDPAARKELTLTIGTEYLLTGEGFAAVSAGATANVLLYSDGFATTHVDETNATTTDAAVSVRFTATTALNLFYFNCDADSTGDVCRFKGFTLREVIPA